MKPILTKIKPANGFSKVVHSGFNVLLPLSVFVLVRMDFVLLAVAVILLSKWRMFAVRPRFWAINVRANAVDIVVGISLLVFMVHSGSQLIQGVWTLIYMGWLLFIKPASDPLRVSVQALIALLCGLMALFVGWGDGPLYGLVFLTGLICFVAAHHFFDSFDESYVKLLSWVWAYFGAGLTWILGHWLLYYNVVAQPVLILLAIGYGLAALYYLDHHDKLRDGVRNQFLLVMVVTLLVMVYSVISSASDKIV